MLLGAQGGSGGDVKLNWWSDGSARGGEFLWGSNVGKLHSVD